jgi:hypothetical protein
MAYFGDMITNILETVDDDSVTETKVKSLINQGVLLCASKVRLPEFESSGTFDTVTDAHNVEIPVSWNYHRSLYAAAIPNGSPIKVVSAIGIIKDKYPEIDAELINDSIEFLMIRNGQLLYFPVPAEITTVYCKFYEQPTPLAKSKDIPSCLPDHLHEPLLESYTLWKLYAKIEDGNEGRKTNTLYYKKEFQEAFQELDDDIDKGQSSPTPLRENTWI